MTEHRLEGKPLTVYSRGAEIDGTDDDPLLSTIGETFTRAQIVMLEHLVGAMDPVSFRVTTSQDVVASVRLACQLTETGKRVPLIAKSSMEEEDRQRWSQPSGWIEPSDLRRIR